MDKIVGKISGGGEIVGHLSGGNSISGTVRISGIAPYGGRYEVTPSEVEQVLPTRGKRMMSDITVNPIPDDYARMAWDGSILHFY